MNILGFIVAAMLLTLMPGPDILFVVTQSVASGRRAGIVFAAGLCSGLVIHTVAVSLGVSVLLMNSPVAFTCLKFAGASYLIYLGIKTFLGRNRTKIDLERPQSVNGKLYRKGVLMNALNPKVILFFLAFFPQFIDAGLQNPIPQMLLLGFIFMVQAFLIFSLVAFLAGRLSSRLISYPRFPFIMSVIESIVYCGVGVSIAFI